MLISMEDETKIFVAWLKRYTKIDKAIKQTVLAEKIGTDQSTISSYITGRTSPNYKTRKLIIVATGVDYESIMKIGRRELGLPEVSETIPPPAPPEQTESEIINAMVGLCKNKVYAERILKNMLEFDKMGTVALVGLSGAIDTLLATTIEERYTNSPFETEEEETG